VYYLPPVNRNFPFEEGVKSEEEMQAEKNNSSK
jgi:hypothetical protein